MKFRLFITGLLINYICFGQTGLIQKKEKEFIQYENSLYSNSNPPKNDPPKNDIMYPADSLEQKLRELLLLPGANKYSFPELRKMGTGITSVHSSSDGKVRLFTFYTGNWDHSNMVQYIDNSGKLQCEDLGHAEMGADTLEAGGFEIDVDSVIVLSPNCYLLFGGAHCGRNCANNVIDYLQIEGTKLDMGKKVFEQRTGFERELLLHFDADNKKMESRKMEYRPDKKELCYTNPDGPDVCLTYQGGYFRKIH